MNNSTSKVKKKICNTCFKKLPLTNDFFSINKRSPDGFYGMCKNCKNIYAAKYRATHKEIIKIRDKKYKAKKRKNPNLKLIEELNEKLKASKPDVFSDKDWESCLNYFSHKCAYCQKAADKLTKDHFIPVSKGGETSKYNILPSCISCNISKLNRDFFIWYPLRYFYSKKQEKKILKYLGYKDKIQQLALL
ncbi:HNH endonuclease [Bacillus sp. BRMEA1]|uniref:HNH endonuclease n=1 Tax=Neobacillus endophyticus TaxID=2738405 RepID=UPI001563498A|nr:HNH endonuclease [Neobacillus endophyticus]NRD80298.1 HNH endonuclease [Neobacillus endophyticus]